MPRIEFLGPSCSGKSTLLAALLGRRSTRAAWLNEWETRLLIGRRIAAERGLLHRIGYGIAQHAPLLWRPVALRYTRIGAREALHRVADEWEPFLRFCLQCMAGLSGAYVRHMTEIRHFIDVAESVAFDWVHVPDRLVVREDSLAGSARYFLDHHRDSSQQRRRYFKLLPPPAGIIHLEAAPEVILDRIERRRQRAGSGAAYPGLREQSLRRAVEANLQFAADGAAQLARRGVHVVRIAADGPLTRQAQLAESLITSVSGRSNVESGAGEGGT